MAQPTAPGRSFRILVTVTAALTLASAGAALAHGDRPSRRHHDKITGVVTSIDAPRFTVETRDDGTAAVVTDADTRYAKTVDATVVDAAPGTFIVAHGRGAGDGTLAAVHVGIRPEPRHARPDENGEKQARAKGHHVQGTVVTNDGNTIVVRTPSGGERTVTTSEDTRVTRMFRTDFDELALGDRVRVFGTRTDDDTMVARGVHIWAVTARETRGSPEPARPENAPARAGREPGPAPSAPTTPAAAPVADLIRGVAPQRPDHRPPPGDRAGVGGVVESIDAPDFALATDRGKITVSTSDATTFRKTLDAVFADAVVGSTVTAAGRRNADGSVSAVIVHVHPGDFGGGDWCGDDRCAATGEVTSSDAGAGTLTLSTANGELLVRTHDDTRFTQTRVATFADLARGQRVWARGTRTDPGTFTAEGVHIDLTTGSGRGPWGGRERR